MESVITSAYSETSGRSKPSRSRLIPTSTSKRMAEDLAEYYSEVAVRCRYLHSEVDTLERIRILRVLPASFRRAPATVGRIENGMASSAAIDAMVRTIVEHISPEKVILFGSHARGNPRPDSDVDLMVVLKEPGSRRAKAAEIYKLLAGAGVAKDVVVVSSEEADLYRNAPGTIIKPALLEGKILYERRA
jgi:predicted nucleotidyltransferase